MRITAYIMQTPTSSFDKSFGLRSVLPGRVTERGLDILAEVVKESRNLRRLAALGRASRDGRDVLGTVHGDSSWLPRLLLTNAASPISTAVSLAGDGVMLLSPLVPVVGAYGASVTISSLEWHTWSVAFSLLLVTCLLLGVAAAAAFAYVLFHEALEGVAMRFGEFRNGFTHGTPAAAVHDDGPTVAVCADGLYVALSGGREPDCEFFAFEAIASMGLTSDGTDRRALTIRFKDARGDLAMPGPEADARDPWPLDRLVGVFSGIPAAERAVHAS